MHGRTSRGTHPAVWKFQCEELCKFVFFHSECVCAQANVVFASSLSVGEASVGRSAAWNDGHG